MTEGAVKAGRLPAPAALRGRCSARRSPRTVADPADVEDEIRDLFAALGD